MQSLLAHIDQTQAELDDMRKRYKAAAKTFEPSPEVSNNLSQAQAREEESWEEIERWENQLKQEEREFLKKTMPDFDFDRYDELINLERGLFIDLEIILLWGCSGYERKPGDRCMN